MWFAGGGPAASRDLFPHLDVAIAYRLLFGVYSGIVPDGIDDLATGDIDWAGDASSCCPMSSAGPPPRA